MRSDERVSSSLSNFNDFMIWFTALGISIVGATTFAFVHFQSKADAKDDKAEMIQRAEKDKAEIIHRLDRFDQKQDDMMKVIKGGP